MGEILIFCDLKRRNNRMFVSVGQKKSLQQFAKQKKLKRALLKLPIFLIYTLHVHTENDTLWLEERHPVLLLFVFNNHEVKLR